MNPGASGGHKVSASRAAQASESACMKQKLIELDMFQRCEQPIESLLSPFHSNKWYLGIVPTLTVRLVSEYLYFVDI